MPELMNVFGDIILCIVITRQYKYNYCEKIIVRCRRTNITYGGYIINETSYSIKMKTRGGRDIELTQPKFEYGMDQNYLDQSS